MAFPQLVLFDLCESILVDGMWAQWTEWSLCAVTCGGGPSMTKTKTRTCTSPAPAHGGDDCDTSVEGSSSGTLCGQYPCPSKNYHEQLHSLVPYVFPQVNGGWAAWSPWGLCPLSCGGTSSTLHTKTRTCTNPAPQYNGTECDSSIQGDTASDVCGQDFCPSIFHLHVFHAGT